ncbi:hypothetical protein ACTFIW_000957 [Dictyostelium discoideum]
MISHTQLYTIKLDKETNKPIISLLHSTGTSDTAIIPTLKCLIVPNKENMDKRKIIINSHSKEEQFKLILDTGNVKEDFVEQINIQVNNEIHIFFIIELDIIDVLFGNDILKDSIINQKDKIINLNNGSFKINYQQSNQLPCNKKAPRKHVAVSNDNKYEPHNPLEDEEDIKEQVIKEEKLMAFTVRDDHPFTPVDSLLNQCKDSKLFSKFDMIMGYFQVLINPEHAKYTMYIERRDIGIEYCIQLFIELPSKCPLKSECYKQFLRIKFSAIVFDFSNVLNVPILLLEVSFFGIFMAAPIIFYKAILNALNPTYFVNINRKQNCSWIYIESEHMFNNN